MPELADTPGMDRFELDLDLDLPCSPEPELLEWAASSAGVLEMKLAFHEVNNADILRLVACTLNKEPGENWVEEEGGLPEYICRIARSIAAKRGKSISNAIQIAVGVARRWAKGVGDVNADTRAKAAAAIAQWDAKRARARARPNKD